MAQMSTRVVAAVAALSCAVPALAACSDDPPSGSPPPSSSSSPTSSATPSGPPTMPVAAKGKTPAAAEAFVRYYVDLINYGLETLDSRPLSDASTSDCELCEGFVRVLKRMHRVEGTYEGGRWLLEKIGSVRRAGGIDVATRVRIEKQTIRQERPRDVARTPERREVVSFFVVENGGKLRIERIVTEAQ